MVYRVLPQAYKSKDKEWMRARMNYLGECRRPFFFMIDFMMDSFFACPLDETNPELIRFSIDGRTNAIPPEPLTCDAVTLEKDVISKDAYLKKFTQVKEHLRAGDTYLLNLTCETPIRLSHTLEQLFHRCSSRYKLLVADDLLVFSPETFVRIREGRIFSFPMKGTIDASLPDARQRILDDPKETAEHYTIVDLIRNDISIVATDVKVDRFRYIEEIRSTGKPLLQVSSEISGRLPGDYPGKIGDIILGLLPAGSICGAPKARTVEIIRECEGYDRGFYTGIMGVSDGDSLESAVMIRYIERTPRGLVFRSGGGITWDSKAGDEYQEMIDKVYVPVI